MVLVLALVDGVLTAAAFVDFVIVDLLAVVDLAFVRAAVDFVAPALAVPLFVVVPLAFVVLAVVAFAVAPFALTAFDERPLAVSVFVAVDFVVRFLAVVPVVAAALPVEERLPDDVDDFRAVVVVDFRRADAPVLLVAAVVLLCATVPPLDAARPFPLEPLPLLGPPLPLGDG